MMSDDLELIFPNIPILLHNIRNVFAIVSLSKETFKVFDNGKLPLYVIYASSTPNIKSSDAVIHVSIGI